MLTELSNQEDMVNRVWACYLALDDPYYTLLSQLYVENDLYENVRIQFDMSPTTFERYRKKALHLIIEYTKSPLSVGELITGSSGKFINHRSGLLQEECHQTALKDRLT